LLFVIFLDFTESIKYQNLFTLSQME
jgi:hypothetical protein